MNKSREYKTDSTIVTELPVLRFYGGTIYESVEEISISVSDPFCKCGQTVNYQFCSVIKNCRSAELSEHLMTVLTDYSDVMWLNPKVVIPMHYNTFPPIEQDPAVFANFVSQFNPKIDVVVMNPDEYFKFNPEEYQD